MTGSEGRAPGPGRASAKARVRGLLGTLALAAAGVMSLAAEDDVLAAVRREFEAGRYGAASALLRGGLEERPEDARLHHWLARCDFELHDYEGSVAHARRSVALEPENSAYHQWLGRSLGRKAERAGWLSALGLARETRREFEEAVRLGPSNVSAQRDLIEFYGEAPGIVGGGWDKALRQAEMLMAIDPVEGHLALAGRWASRKEFAKAEREYRFVLEAHPGTAGPCFEAADFYIERRDLTRLGAAVALAATIEASDARLAYYRGVEAVLAGDGGGDAESWLQRYLTLVPERSDYPSHASAREWLGRLQASRTKRAAPPGGAP